MKKLLLLICLVISHITFAQKFAVKGRVLDNTDAALPSATVLILQEKDSSLVSFGATDAQGAFEIKNVNKGNYLFKVSFLGFTPYYKSITPPAATDVLDLGTIKLQPLSNELKEVLVQGEKSPVVIKKDTIEYNADSFKTQPNAAVEELLKKLPGVDVDADGNFMVKGEKVQRVTVDGKEFFGKDPKMATKNLPADAIDKVQVFDKKSDQAVFTGIDDGQREKTINLQLKEEKRNSAFGNVMAGAGTNERYQAKANINRFNKGQQLSFLGMANNVNSQGFGFDEYMNFNGGSMQMGGGRIMITNNNTNGVPLNFGGRMNGLMNTQAAGLNFNNQFTRKTEANGSYFFNNLNQNMSRNVARETFLPAGSFLSDENTRQESSNMNHRGNFSIDQKIDSLNSLKVTGNFSYNETSQTERGQSQTFSPEGTMQNKGTRDAFSEGTVFNMSSNLLYRHRFGKPGRFLTANAQLSANQNENSGKLNAVNEFVNRPSSVIKQESNQDNSAYTYGFSLSYTEPLGNRMYLETNYNFRQDLNQVDREVYDQEGDQRVLNRTLSNKYNSDFLYHRAGLNYKVNREQYNLTIGSSLQQSRLEGEMLLLEADDVKRTFQNVLPTVRFNYDLANNRRLNVNYETNVQEPTLRQLQPIIDNSNPLSLYVGNENLRPAYMHNWRLNYNSFDAGTLMSFFAMVTVNYTTNAITNAQSFDENFVRTTQPVNVDDNTMISAYGNFSFPVKKLNSRFHIGTNLREQYTVNVQNEVENDIHIRSATGNIRYSYRLQENFELSLRADLTAQRTKYESGEAEKQLFFNKTYAGEVTYRFLKGFNFNTTFDYLIYDNDAADFNQTIPLWNMSVSKQFLKNNTGELKLSAVNLLDRSMGVNLNANSLYVERETLNSLGQYFMLSFTYTINKHLNPMASRGGGIQIIR